MSLQFFYNTILSPVFSMCTIVLQFPIFGVELWRCLLALLLFGFVVGFIVKGNVGHFGFIHSFGNIGSRSQRSSGSGSFGSFSSRHSDSKITDDM